MLSKVKLIRLQKGLTGKTVAKELKISNGYLSQLENGSAVITEDILRKLSKVYSVPIRELI